MMEFNSHVGFHQRVSIWRKNHRFKKLHLLVYFYTAVKSTSNHHLGESFLHVPSIKQSQIQENLVKTTVKNYQLNCKLGCKLPIVNSGIKLPTSTGFLPGVQRCFCCRFVEANGNWDKALEVAKTKDYLPGGQPEAAGKGEAQYQL